MVVICGILVWLLAGAAVLLVIQAVRVKEMRRKMESEAANANRTVRMLVNLLQNPAPTTPPDQLITSIGDALRKIIVGADTQVTNPVVDSDEIEVEPYFPDVEFDEWLGTEGIPPKAGWWSPPPNGAQSASANLPTEIQDMD